ncbi:angiopoietin-related protein 7-like [Ptychodera flava]|uniref:angiopoietin-related protein 7-like n=1 Tax=Ptychodera flava TaxID=63121 RepID=UPI00396A2645
MLSSLEMKIQASKRPWQCFWCKHFAVCLILTVIRLVSTTEFEGQHVALKQGDRCVYTLLVPHTTGEECRPLCEIFEHLCSKHDVASELIVQLQAKMSHCNNGKQQSTTSKHGDSCTYLFSQASPIESDECPDLCNAMTEICLVDETISELREWIINLGSETERLKKRILQLEDSLESQKSDFMQQISAAKLHHPTKQVHDGRKKGRHHKSVTERLRDTLHVVATKASELQSKVDICMDELNVTKEGARKELENKELLQQENERCRSETERMSSVIVELLGQNQELKKMNVHAVSPISTLATTVQGKVNEYAEDCSVVQPSGLYTVDPDNDGKPFQVYCDVETDSAGWTVIQRRQDGSVDFYRGWEDYKNGFGDLNGEFWLGNDKIHRLTNQGRRYELRVDLENFENETRFAQYDDFTIANERRRYEITLGSYSGNAGDSMKFDNGKQFTTKDNDNDRSAKHNCAVSFTGAWWYSSCSLSNLNGQYLDGENNEWGRGIVWYDWLDMKYSLKKTEIRIRPALKDSV